MPTYEYKCDACGHSFDQFQSITAQPLKKCPACHRPKLRRLIGAGAGLIFKGSGFYITDYRSESYKSAAKSESGAPASANSSDSKPAPAAAKSKETTPSAAPAPAPAKPAAKPSAKTK